MSIALKNKPPIKVQYKFQFSEREDFDFTIVIDGNTFDIIEPKVTTIPSWASLEEHKCDHCTRKSHDHKDCPIAKNIASLLDSFSDFPSYEEANIIVITEEREYHKRAAVQHGIGSLLGIFMVASGCSYLEKLKPLLRFHLPFASLEETIFKATSTYMLGQYFLHRKGIPADFDLDGLAQIYKDIHEVNLCMAARLRGAFTEDAPNNALVILDMYSRMIDFEIKKSLDKLEYLFQSYY